MIYMYCIICIICLSPGYDSNMLPSTPLPCSVKFLIEFIPVLRYSASVLKTCKRTLRNRLFVFLLRH